MTISSSKLIDTINIADIFPSIASIIIKKASLAKQIKRNKKTKSLLASLQNIFYSLGVFAKITISKICLRDNSP